MDVPLASKLSRTKSPPPHRTPESPRAATANGWRRYFEDGRSNPENPDPRCPINEAQLRAWGVLMEELGLLGHYDGGRVKNLRENVLNVMEQDLRSSLSKALSGGKIPQEDLDAARKVVPRINRLLHASAAHKGRLNISNDDQLSVVNPHTARAAGFPPVLLEMTGGYTYWELIQEDCSKGRLGEFRVSGLSYPEAYPSMPLGLDGPMRHWVPPGFWTTVSRFGLYTSFDTQQMQSITHQSEQ